LKTDQLQAKKHKNVLLANSHLGCMTNYVCKLELSKAEYNLAVYEGTYAYHTVLHNHSFSGWIVQQFYRKNLCRQEILLCKTKCESIVTNVYAPWALEELKNDLICVKFVTVS
jgi:hypothetical protein